MDLQVLLLLKYAYETEAGHWCCLWRGKLGFWECCVGLCSSDLKGNKVSLFTEH